ncbi:hypothetical protein BLNAU_11514 [Blattamonas nauphoetae]|uniref:Uncharacterized protein n=1 Tax=Blattamonas nauphoetae TaxID=2049346 RepID=A0ABQ9XRF3_9EUKA|nr:hypothetical protein BLNAU_11514 [Blattamonas nauphoetae]
MHNRALEQKANNLNKLLQSSLRQLEEYKAENHAFKTGRMSTTDLLNQTRVSQTQESTLSTYFDDAGERRTGNNQQIDPESPSSPTETENELLHLKKIISQKADAEVKMKQVIKSLISQLKSKNNQEPSKQIMESRDKAGLDKIQEWEDSMESVPSDVKQAAIDHFIEGFTGDEQRSSLRSSPKQIQVHEIAEPEPTLSSPSRAHLQLDLSNPVTAEKEHSPPYQSMTRILEKRPQLIGTDPLPNLPTPPSSPQFNPQILTDSIPGTPNSRSVIPPLSSERAIEITLRERAPSISSSTKSVTPFTKIKTKSKTKQTTSKDCETAQVTTNIKRAPPRQYVDTSIQIPNDWKKQGVRGSRGIPDTSTRLPTKTEYLTRDFPSYPQSAYTSQIYPYDHFSTNHSDIVAPSPHHDRPRPQPNSTQMQAHLSPQYVPHPPSSPTVSLKITTRSSPPPSPPSTQSALIARRNLARSAQLESKYHNRFQTRRVDEMLRYFQPDDLDADQAFSSETSAFLGSKQPLPPQVPRTSHSTSSRADRASHRSAFERYLSQAQHLPRQRALRSSSADQPRRRGPSFAAERLKYTDRTSPPQTRFVPDRQFSPHELDPLYSSFSASRVFSPRAMKGWREKEKIRKGRTVRRRESTTLSETSPRRASVKSDHSSTLHSLLPVVSSPRDVPLSALPPSAFPCPVSPRSSSSPAPHATAPPFNSSQLYFTPPFSPSTTLKPSSTLLSSSFLPSNPFSPQYPSRALQTPDCAKAEERRRDDTERPSSHGRQRGGSGELTTGQPPSRSSLGARFLTHSLPSARHHSSRVLAVPVSCPFSPHTHHQPGHIRRPLHIRLAVLAAS